MADFARFRHSIGRLAVIALFAGQAFAQAPDRRQQTSSCRKFVQAFYDWYVPFMKKETKEPAWNVVLQRKPEVLSPDLLKALKIDSDASAHAKGDIVGLDFDPFSGGQDPEDRYEARGVSWQGGKCSVEVWSVSPASTDPKPTKPDAVAELMFVGGHWQFQNFRYPEINTNLVTVLAELREERRKH